MDSRCVQALRGEQVGLCLPLALLEAPCTTPWAVFEPHPILCPHSREKQGEKFSNLGQEDRFGGRLTSIAVFGGERVQLISRHLSSTYCVPVLYQLLGHSGERGRRDSLFLELTF